MSASAEAIRLKSRRVDSDMGDPRLRRRLSEFEKLSRDGTSTEFDKGFAAALREAEASKIFVNHIEKHLMGTEIDGSLCVEKVMCKICNKDIDTIEKEERLRGIESED